VTLTLGSGPLGGRPGSFNFDLGDAPQHRLYFEDYPRRVRALVGSHSVLDSTRGKLLFETGIPPVYYLPLADLDQDCLEGSDHTTHCPFKGDASYFHLKVGDRIAEDAVWHYPDPLGPAAWLEGFCALYPHAADVWLHEDEPVRGHLRDPYHRVDVLESSRKVTVRAAGVAIAESDRPKMLFETGLAPRPYLLRADVLPGILSRAEETTHCPYKGEASYWNVDTGGGRVIEAGAFSYEAPLTDALAIAGHLAFEGDDVEVTID